MWWGEIKVLYSVFLSFFFSLRKWVREKGGGLVMMVMRIRESEKEKY